jgi:hypothetical protein
VAILVGRFDRARTVRPLDNPNSTTVLLVIGAGVVVLIVVPAVAIILWRRGEVGRARRAALASFEPFAHRFGVRVTVDAGHDFPSMVLVGPHGVPVTLRAELVSSGSPMNDEPRAWVRKTLAVLGFVFGCLVYALLGLAGANLAPSPGSPQRPSSGGGVRRTTLFLPLPRYFGALVLEDRRKAIWSSRNWTGATLLGDPAFDDAFLVLVPFETRAALTPAVRAALVAFRREHGTFAVEGGYLSWSRRTYVTEGLDGVLDGLARLTAALGATSRLPHR